MIASCNRTWWQQFSIAGVLVALGACSSGSTTPEPVEETEPGAVSGVVEVYIADFDDGTTEKRFILRNAAGDEQKLVFDREPDIEPGARLHVWGKQAGDAINVVQYKVASRVDPSGIGSQGSPLIGVTPQAPHVVCPVLVTINGGVPPSTVTVDAIEAQFHGGGKSVNNFYIENSYGKNSIAGKTYGPLDFTGFGACGTSALAKALTPMIPEKCDQYSWVIAPRQAGCGWAGLASLGTPASPSANTWYNASIGCVVTVQEPGHNYGMNHSSSMTCSNGWFSDNLSTCTHSEYGDKFDPMGGGCRHMNVFQKQYEQWFGGCNAIKVTSSGTFNLLPTERACDGVQSMQLVFPGGKVRTFNRPAGGGGGAGVDQITSYYLEYRTSIGTFDTGMAPQVLVHAGVNPQPMAGSTKSGSHSWLLDASPAAKAGTIGAQPGMIAGGTFSDPAGGLKVTVVSMDADKAVIQVDYTAGSGDPTCLDNTSLVAPGPTTCTGPIGDAGSPPPMGTGGASGAGGAGGRGGSAGAGGSLGGSGGGATDAGIPPGVGGQAGTPGGGVGGSAGAGGSGQPPGVGGAAGVSNPGSAGTSKGTGTGGPPPDAQGGCACHVGTSSGSSPHSGLGLVALGLGALARRRQRRS